MILWMIDHILWAQQQNHSAFPQLLAFSKDVSWLNELRLLHTTLRRKTLVWDAKSSIDTFAAEQEIAHSIKYVTSEPFILLG